MRLREPEDGQLGQHLAAIGDAGRQDVVEGGEPVGGDHQKLVVGQLVRVAHLAAREKLEGQLGRAQRGASYHAVLTPRERRSNARSVFSRPAHGSKTWSRLAPMRSITARFFSI